MNVLLDSHTLLWFLRDDLQLSQAARATIENPENRKYVSIASVWEISIKAGLGKMSLGEPVASLLGREIPRNNFDLLPISFAHATAVESLPQHHRDPFDRIIAAQVQTEQLTLLSRDTVFDQYGVRRVW